MAVEIRVPPLGESLVDAVVGTWLKQEGESVNRGDSLVELETDKVNLDVTAEEDGVLARIERREGEVVTVGEVLGLRGTGFEWFRRKLRRKHSKRVVGPVWSCADR